jgi:hypothetical protein
MWSILSCFSSKSKTSSGPPGDKQQPIDKLKDVTITLSVCAEKRKVKARQAAKNKFGQSTFGVLSLLESKLTHETSKQTKAVLVVKLLLIKQLHN